MKPTSQFTRRSLLATGALAGGGAVLSACTSPTAATSGGDERLTFLILGADEGTVDILENDVLAAFTESTGIAVELQTTDWGSAFQRITTSAASNSLPDVFMIGGIWTAPLASRGVLLDITERFNAWDESGQFYEGMVEDSRWNDVTYAVPFNTDVRSGVYRQDMLDEAGVTDLPKTWEEFRRAAEQIKDAGISDAPIHWGIDSSIGIQQSFAQLFLQAGGTYFTEDGAGNFHSDEGIRALEFLVGTFNDRLADFNLVDTGSGASPLVSGLCAQTFTGASIMGNALSNDAQVAEHLVAGPALSADGEEDARPAAWVNKLAIAATTANPDGAWRLLSHLTSGESLGAVVEQYGGLPPRSDLAELEWIGPFEKQVLDSAPSAISQPPDPRMLDIGPMVTEELDPAIRGLRGVEETLEAIDARIAELDE